MAAENRKILIVEDDESYLWILKQGFTNEPFVIFTAGNGEDGLKIIETEKPSLILLDILMPIMDGIEMAKQMKAKGFDIPVIFLTNMSDVSYMNKALEAVVSDYIIKSETSIDQIVARVKAKLGLK